MNLFVTVALVRGGKIVATEAARATVPDEEKDVLYMAERCARAAALKAWGPVGRQLLQEQQQRG